VRTEARASAHAAVNIRARGGIEPGLNTTEEKKETCRVALGTGPRYTYL